MTDDDLRTLEHSLEANDDPKTRLHYYRVLERAGQRDRAFAALLPGRDHREVRDEIARHPCWSRAEADPGSTNSIDVQPLVFEPRIQWLSVPEPSAFRRRAEVILASPLGVVTGTVLSAPGGHPVGNQTRLHDADDGRLRREDQGSPLGLVGGAALLIGRTLRGFDLWTGSEPEAAAAIDASPWSRMQGPELPQDEADETESLPLPWRTARRVLIGNHVFASGDGTVAALPRGGKAATWSVRGKFPRIDGNGLVVTAIDASAISLVNGQGAIAWTAPFGATDAFSRDLVCASDPNGFVVLRRSDGAVLGALNDRPWFPTSPAIVVRDVIFVAEWVAQEGRGLFRVSAFRATGEVLWRIPFEGVCPSQVVRLAASHGRLYCLALDGTVFCLGPKHP